MSAEPSVLLQRGASLVELIARFPLSNFPPHAGERANESLREFYVKDYLDIAALEKIKRGEDPNG